MTKGIYDNQSKSSADGISDDDIDEDTIFHDIQERISQGSLSRHDSVSTIASESQGSGDDFGIRTADNFTYWPYGFQPKAAYEHPKKHSDIIAVTYNGRMHQFVVLDAKGASTWNKDALQQAVSRPLNYPKYEHRLITNVVYARKHNVYFTLNKDFSLKVLNRDFEETCSVSGDLRSILFMVFNPVRDELITGGVGGTKVWRYHKVAEKSFKEIRPMANFKLTLKHELKDVGGSWVRKVELDQELQHLYCCSDTDLKAYDMEGQLIFSFERAHSLSITGCAYSSTARLLVTASSDSEVKIWSIVGGLITTLRGHSRAVTNLVLHPESPHLVLTSSLDGTVRLWSLHTMDCIYMTVVSTEGVQCMGLTDDRYLFLGTRRNITLWSLNTTAFFWAMARSRVERITLVAGEGKSTRVLTCGKDGSVRVFSRPSHKNLSTVLPPPPLSPLQTLKDVSYNRVQNLVFVLIDTRQLWIYTTKTDPACRVAIWDLHNIQERHLVSKDDRNIPSPTRPSSALFGKKGATHRALESGQGNELVADCLCLCYLNSAATVWTEEGPCSPLQHNYLLLGLEDGRILFMDPTVKGKKYIEFRAHKDPVVQLKHDLSHNALVSQCEGSNASLFQIWDLPSLELLYKVYTTLDVTHVARIDTSFMTGHMTGAVCLHTLIPLDDSVPQYKPKFASDGETDSSVVEGKYEHNKAVIAVDACTRARIFCTASGDGSIKIWDESKMLMTEIILEDSLSSACFINHMPDLLIGFQNHIFIIHHSRICSHASEEEEDISDSESEIYEDPAVMYEGVAGNPNPTDMDNYLVPFNMDMLNDEFMAVKKDEEIDEEEQQEEEEGDLESELSFAPTSIYDSPPTSPRRLSDLDLTLTARVNSVDILNQVELDDEDLELQGLSFELPKFGVSPGPSPSPSPPSTPTTPSHFSVSEGGASTDEEKGKTETETPMKKVRVEPEEPDDWKPQRAANIRIDAEALLRNEARKQRPATSKPAPQKQSDHSHAKPQARAVSAPVKKKQHAGPRKMPRRGDKRSKMTATDRSNNAAHRLKAAAQSVRKKVAKPAAVKEVSETSVAASEAVQNDPDRKDTPKFDLEASLKVKTRRFGAAAESGVAPSRPAETVAISAEQDKGKGSLIGVSMPSSGTSDEGHGTLSTTLTLSDSKVIQPQTPDIKVSNADIDELLKVKDTLLGQKGQLSLDRSKSPGMFSDYGTEWTFPTDEGLSQLGELTGEPDFGSRLQTIFRPATVSHTNRATTPADRPKRPHTAHLLTDPSMSRKDLERKFRSALREFQGEPGNEDYVEYLYQNDGNKFEKNWHEKAIERHLLLKMQRQLRARSAIDKKVKMDKAQESRRRSLHGHRGCETPHVPVTQPDRMTLDVLSRVRRANTAMGEMEPYPRTPVPPEGVRPQTAMGRFHSSTTCTDPTSKILDKSEKGTEQPFRFRLSRTSPPPHVIEKKPSEQIDVRLLDPRNPAARAFLLNPSKSIPSRCHRYILINQPKDGSDSIIPSNLEQHLINDRFPQLRDRWFGDLDLLQERPSDYPAPLQPGVPLLE